MARQHVSQIPSVEISPMTAARSVSGSVRQVGVGKTGPMSIRYLPFLQSAARENEGCSVTMDLVDLPKFGLKSDVGQQDSRQLAWHDFRGQENNICDQCYRRTSVHRAATYASN